MEQRERTEQIGNVEQNEQTEQTQRSVLTEQTEKKPKLTRGQTVGLIAGAAVLVLAVAAAGLTGTWIGRQIGGAIGGLWEQEGGGDFGQRLEAGWDALQEKIGDLWEQYAGYSTALQANWGFRLPEEAGCREVFGRDSGPDFHGDGIRYHVFSYREEGLIAAMLPWSSREEEPGLAARLSEDAAAWLEELEIPRERLPEMEGCRFWHDSQEDGSEITVFWNPEQDRLYVVELFL